MFQDFKNGISAAMKTYPLRWRAANAVIVLTVLAASTIVRWHFQPSSWRFEPLKIIVISACTFACLFQPRGRWFMFSLGVALGAILLAAVK